MRSDKTHRPGFEYKTQPPRRRIAEANQQAVRALPSRAQTEVLRTIESRFGHCRLVVRGTEEITWCNSRFIILQFECREVAPLMPRYSSVAMAFEQCTAIAREDNCVVIASSDCNSFGEVLAETSCDTLTQEAMDEIARLWETVAPWDYGAFHRTTRTKNGGPIYERQSEYTVERLNVHLNKEGRLLGTSHELVERQVPEKL